MKDYFIHKEDLSIERKDGYASVYESECNKVFDFPIDWTDAMIYTAFRLADFAYACGILDGRIEFETKVREAAGFLSSLGVKVKERP